MGSMLSGNRMMLNVPYLDKASHHHAQWESHDVEYLTWTRPAIIMGSMLSGNRMMLNTLPGQDQPSSGVACSVGIA